MSSDIHTAPYTIYSATPGAGDWLIDCRLSGLAAGENDFTWKATVDGVTVNGAGEVITKDTAETTMQAVIPIHAAADEAVVVTVQSSSASDTAVTATATATLEVANAVQWGGATLPTIPTAPAIADAVLDEAKGTHAGFLTTLALETTTQSLKTTTDKLATAMEADGAVYRFTQNALEKAPTAASVTVNATTIGEAPEVNFLAYQYGKLGIYPTWSFTSEVALNGKTLVLVAFLPGASSASFALTSTASNIIVSGDDYKTVTITGPDTHTSTPKVYKYVLRNTTDDSVVAHGVITIEQAPDVPA